MSWRVFFVPSILSEGNFFNICVLSQCIWCTEYTFRIYILLHIKKHYFKTFLLVLKIVESLISVSLKKVQKITRDSNNIVNIVNNASVQNLKTTRRGYILVNLQVCTLPFY